MMGQRSFSILWGAGVLAGLVLVGCSSSDRELSAGEALQTEVASLEPTAPASARPAPSSPPATTQPDSVADSVAGAAAPSPAGRAAPSRATGTPPSSSRSSVREGRGSQGSAPAVRQSPLVSASSASPAAADGSALTVQRLIVAEGIADREPHGANTHFSVGAEGLFAFAELANAGAGVSEVFVVFRHEGGREVGNVSLSIPGDAPRWRTWARSRLISEPGQWRAILRAGDGTELASTAFTVQ